MRRRNQSEYLDEDQLSKISNIFCAEIDKPNNPQRQMMEEGRAYTKPKEVPNRINQTQSGNPRVSTTIDEGRGKTVRWGIFIDI